LADRAQSPAAGVIRYNEGHTGSGGSEVSRRCVELQFSLDRGGYHTFWRDQLACPVV